MHSPMLAPLPPVKLHVFPKPSQDRYCLSVATEGEREVIYELRHEVYAREIGQHPVSRAGRLHDALDDCNTYLVIKSSERICGFVSVTSPGASCYSIDKYFPRAALPFSFDDKLYEVRLLTVLQEDRGSEVAMLLMYAAFRWVESHGGQRIMAIGRREVIDLYLRVGLQMAGLSVQSGAVTYDLLHAEVSWLREKLPSRAGLWERLERRVDWQLHFPFRRPAACFHGGKFFEAIGARFETLERGAEIINADVLDAWFPPSPKVLEALQKHLGWIARTSPPIGCEGLIATIAEVRGVDPANILPGAGSSDLIFRALRHWLTRDSRVLLLDPTYGEYHHVLEQVVGCRVDRLILNRSECYDVSLRKLEAAFALGYDLIILVNPNSPTGRHVTGAELETVLAKAPPATRVWVDETYVEFVGTKESLERFASASENVIVCKSMSKVYALSGMRVAYLCARQHQLEGLRAITPPWVVSLPAQVAAVEALKDSAYYEACYRETHVSREWLRSQLELLGWDTIAGTANFLLCHLPPDGPDAATVVSQCQRRGLYLRDAGAMGSQLGSQVIRVAVKGRATNAQMVEILRDVWLLRR